MPLSHPETQISIIPRPQLLAELARRDPQSLEARVLALARHQLGPYSLIHLDQDEHSLWLIVELDKPAMRVSYGVNEQLHVCVSSSASLTGEFVRSIKHNPVLPLGALLDSLKEWAKVSQLS